MFMQNVCSFWVMGWGKQILCIMGNAKVKTETYKAKFSVKWQTNHFLLWCHIVFGQLRIDHQQQCLRKFHHQQPPLR